MKFDIGLLPVGPLSADAVNYPPFRFESDGISAILSAYGVGCSLTASVCDAV